MDDSFEERIARLEHIVKEQAALLMTVADLVDYLTRYIQQQTAGESRGTWNAHRETSTGLRDTARQHLGEVSE